MPGLSTSIPTMQPQMETPIGPRAEHALYRMVATSTRPLQGHNTHLQTGSTPLATRRRSRRRSCADGRQAAARRPRAPAAPVPIPNTACPSLHLLHGRRVDAEADGLRDRGRAQRRRAEARAAARLLPPPTLRMPLAAAAAAIAVRLRSATTTAASQRAGHTRRVACVLQLRPAKRSGGEAGVAPAGPAGRQQRSLTQAAAAAAEGAVQLLQVAAGGGAEGGAAAGGGEGRAVAAAAAAGSVPVTALALWGPAAQREELGRHGRGRWRLHACRGTRQQGGSSSEGLGSSC